MAKLDDFNKIIHNGNEIGKVLHQGKTIWTQDSDFVKVNGNWVYRGSELEIKIPHVIRGESITSYNYMFSGSSTYNATPVTRVVSDNPSVTSMSSMFSMSKATTLDLSSFNTSSVTNMSNMFRSSAATTLDLSSFNTSSVNNMSNMFNSSKATTLDLSSFNTSSVNSMSYMFYRSAAKVGYARTQTDANKFNASSGKPAGLNFVVKP